MTTYQTIKPIETKYKGYRFRSRLEARWAVFFDVLGIEWEYEIEGFDLGDAGWYLPDFWLPQFKAFVEIKPTIESAKSELNRIGALSNRNHVIVLYSMPNPADDLDWASTYGILVEGETPSLFRFGYTDHVFGIVNNRNGWSIWDSPTWWTISHQRELDTTIGIAVTVMEDNPAIVHALSAARSARFEHGETPKV